MDTQGSPTSLEAVTNHPMGVVRRYVFALLGGFLAMGAHIYISHRAVDWFSPSRIGSAIASGLIFGVMIGLVVLIASEYPQRLKSVWSLPARVALALGGGTLVAALAWFAFHYLILFIAEPDWSILLLGGLGLAAGFALHGIWGHIFSTPLQPIGWVVGSALLIFIPIYIGYQNYQANSGMALLYYSPNQDWLLLAVGLPFALVIAISGYLPLLWQMNARKTHA
jgi:hypothetical protein